MARIIDISAVATRAASDEATLDNSAECVIVRIDTDAGVTGAGESTGPVEAVRALLEDRWSWPWDRSVAELLIGRELDDPRAIFRELYEARIWSARAGVGHVALAGVDMAVWDAAAKVQRLPVWRLLGRSRKDHVRPYVTLYNETGSFDEGVRWTLEALDWVIKNGFHAAKVEASPDVAPTDEYLLEFAKRVRRHVGAEFTLLFDLLYRWPTAAAAAPWLQRLDDHGFYLFEAPLHPDNITGYRHLSRLTRTPLAGVEIFSSYAEFAALMSAGRVGIVQPAATRLGITETDRLARAARRLRKRMIPFGWTATALGTAANLHLAWANSNVPLVEYVPPELYPGMTLRRSVARPHVRVRGGIFERPERPGLGPELVEPLEA